MATDCSTDGTRRVRDFPLPVGDTETRARGLDENRGAFAGMAATWPVFSVIVPDLCHDGHNPIEARDNNGHHALTDAGGSPACQGLAGDPPGTASGDVAKHRTVDCWLQENLHDVAMDVGPNGVVIITTDEGTTDEDRLPMIIVPGEDPSGAGSILVCVDGAPCATSTYYDHGSTILALEDAFAVQDPTGASDAHVYQGRSTAVPTPGSATTTVSTPHRCPSRWPRAQRSPTPDQIGEVGSVFLRLRRLDDPCLRIRYEGSLHAAPNGAHRIEKCFGLVRGVELEIDHHVVRVVCGSKDPMPADAGSLAADGVAVEGALPFLIVMDRMLDAQDGHVRPLHSISLQ